MKQFKEISSKLNVLYVEDDQTVREQMTILLNKLFKKVYVTCDGKEGLGLFREIHEEIDLVISDISMPNMNGLKMVEEIKKLIPKQHTVLISAHNDTHNLIHAIELGVDQFLIKPVSTNDFLTKMMKVLVLINREQEEILLNRLYTDSDTGLLTRFKLFRDMEDLKECNLLMISINNFTIVSELFGFNFATIYLKKITYLIGEYLQNGLATKKLYRFGPDKLVILSEKDQRLDVFESEIEQFLFKLENHLIIVEGLSFPISPKLFVGFGQKKQTDNPDDIVTLMEVAVKLAQTNQNKFVHFRKEMLEQNDIDTNIFWVEKIVKALEHNKIVLYYQPIINNQTNQIDKYECLVRLIDEAGNVHSPAFFLDIAKRTGLYISITKKIIQQAFTFFNQHDSDFSINLSTEDLLSKEILEIFLTYIKTYPKIAHRLTIEILESESIENYKEVDYFLKQVKELGVQIAIDDFGTGYSNFTHLIKLDIDMIKIDGSLIKNVHSDFSNQTIVKSIVEFSKTLKMKTVAEFVHCKEVHDKVVELGVDYSQGFFFSEPSEMILEKAGGIGE